VFSDVATADNFEIDAGGTLSGPGFLSVPGKFFWKGGDVQGGVQLELGGPSFIDSFGGVTLDGAALLVTPRSSVSWDGGPIEALNKAFINSAGTFTVQSNANFLGDGSAVLKNLGSFVETGQSSFSGVSFENALIPSGPTGFVQVGITGLAGGALTLDSSFVNQGGVHVAELSTLSLDGGGADNDPSLSTSPGTFVVEFRGTLEFGGGNYLLINGTQLNGTGTVKVTGGTLSIGQNPFDTATAQNLQVNPGGTVTGPGILAINSTFFWSGGNLQGGLLLDITGSATMAINSTGAVTLNEAFLEIDGGASAFWFDGLMQTGNGSQILNAGQFAVFSGTGLSGDGSPGLEFINLGSFLEFSSGTGIDIPFFNIGAVTVEPGAALSLFGGGDNGLLGGGPGAFIVDAGATLQFSFVDYTLINGTQLTGAGTVLVTGGTLDIGLSGADVVNAQNIENAGGVIQGFGDLEINSEYLWTGGAVEGNVTVNIVGSMTINSLFGVTLDGNAAILIEPEGTANWLAGPIYINSNASIVNAGLFIDQAASFVSGTTTNPFALTNIGTFDEDSGTPVNIDVPFTNSQFAVVNIVQGSTLNLNGGGSSAGNFSVDASSVLCFEANYTLNDGASFTGETGSGAGQVMIANEASLNLDSGTGSVAISGVTLTVESGTAVNWLSGDIDATSNAAIVNQGGFVAYSDNTLFSDCTTIFVNLGGALLKDAGAGTTTIQGDIANIDGTIVAFTGSIFTPGC
jgi:hypothetical protein